MYQFFLFKNSLVKRHKRTINDSKTLYKLLEDLNEFIEISQKIT